MIVCRIAATLLETSLEKIENFCEHDPQDIIVDPTIYKTFLGFMTFLRSEMETGREQDLEDCFHVISEILLKAGVLY